MNKMHLLALALFSAASVAQASAGLPQGITLNTPFVEAMPRLTAISFDPANTTFEAYKRVDDKTGETFAVTFRGHGTKNPVYSQDFHNPYCYVESTYSMWHTPEMAEAPLLAMFDRHGKPLSQASWPVSGRNGVDTQYWARDLTLRQGVKFRVVKGAELKGSPTYGCKTWSTPIDDSPAECLERGDYINTYQEAEIPVRPTVSGGDKFVTTVFRCVKTGYDRGTKLTVGDVLNAPDQTIHLEF